MRLAARLHGAHAPRLRILLVVLVTLPLAGCMGAFGGEGEGSMSEPEEALGVSRSMPDPGAGAFKPPFDLVPPRILAQGSAGAPVSNLSPGDPVFLAAEFPPDTGVDPGKVLTYLWDLGDGQALAGRNVTYQYDAPGLKAVRVTVQDEYGRTASAETALDVWWMRGFEGVIRLGSGGADRHPPGDAIPNDHRDHPVKLPVGVQRLSVTLDFDRRDGFPNLFLRLVGPEGEVVAAVEGAGAPKTIELQSPPGGAWTVRVSGDQGVDVPYRLDVVGRFTAKA